MATTFGPPVPIDGPPPIPPPFGLYSVSTALAETERAAMGVSVTPYPPETPAGFDPCSTGTYRDKAAGSAIPRPLFAGFTAYTPITCTSRGVGSESEFRRRVAAALTATDAFIAEQQLVAGTVMPLNPYVGDSGVTVLDNTGINVIRAIALLEEEIAETGRQGVIHLTPGSVAAAGFSNLRINNGRLETAAGTPVISGSGYTDQKPAGQGALAATEQWAWATGPVFHWRGDVYVPGDRAANTDHTTNVTTFRAERELVVGWDGVLQAAVLVDSAA